MNICDKAYNAHVFQNTLDVYNTLKIAGMDLGLRQVGYDSVQFIKHEHGEPSFGDDLTPHLTPFSWNCDHHVAIEVGYNIS